MRSLIFSTLLAASLLASELPLMPLPEKVELRTGQLLVDGAFTIALTGYSEPRLEAAAVRTLRRLSRQSGIPIPAVVSSDAAHATFVLDCAHAGSAVQQPVEDESYSLDITPNQARIKAPNPLGILRGLETFLQLVDWTDKGFATPAVSITDRPRFPWRGLNLDCSRHFMPLPIIERTIDGLAAVKMNVFHWHLTDDQGFRFESKAFPKLHGLGSDGLFYTQDGMRHIVAYARERGIRVVPEIEMPGHSSSWFPGYPELASGPGPFAIERAWGVFKPTMDPSNEALYTTLDALFGELADVFPDPCVHIGGDEVEPTQWRSNPRIQAFMKENQFADVHALQAYFNRRVRTLLEKRGKRMLGWDEILHPSLPKDIVIQSWQGQKSLVEAAKQGYQGILSSGYYLDHVSPASFHYLNDPLGGESAALTAVERSAVLGGEACMWAEYISDETVESRIWPRTAAIAERLWSPATVVSLDSMYERLDRTSIRLEWLGLTHRSTRRLMLQRMAGSADLAALEEFASLLEPIKGLSRSSARTYTQSVPLNRLVDAAWPESEVVRHFAALTRNPKAHLPEIRRELTRWQSLATRLKPTLAATPALKETALIAQEMAQVAAAGLTAIDALATGHRPSAKWLAAQKQLLTRAAKPQAELLLMLVPPVRDLVHAAEKLR